ncbi:aldehyde dehydrogenase (NADP(+)) [Terrimonas pollutisoli]|uniref:aldehyde dehydrogenase (NADP(+)) n=1 Tax=Terrimonas pollutisoli TaxID=3034147 RepID=UPI0023ECD328|nr:aldehyde dehydrogenase (NADP(+)) [Terrimonas sp. H1YJ31]
MVNVNELTVSLNRSSTGILKAFSPVTKEYLPGEYPVTTISEINNIGTVAEKAFSEYSRKTAEQRAIFLETIADEIMALGDELIQLTMLESGLPEARLIGERARTVGQLKLFAEVLREGSWVDAVIDTALPDRKPLPRPDLRKMLVPIGPVLVFGASNFPFAFSTAGGDTASALAAGNPVIVKAHEGHPGTHALMANAIKRAAQKTNMPDAVFSSVVSDEIDTIQYLVKHEAIKAIGFTGSYKAGMSIFSTATTSRKTPIPVYAEMSSINPVLLLPGKLEKESSAVATQLAASITLGTGQFCTNPGLLFLIESEAAEKFIDALGSQLKSVAPTTMLNKNVCNNYYNTKNRLQQQAGVKVVAAVESAANDIRGAAVLLQTNGADFIANENLQAEVFGPCSLIVKCKDAGELLQAVSSLHGQLTGTVIGLKEDLEVFASCIEVLTGKVGRLLYNGVPTGVEVCHAMVHGGPYPATTNAGSTSVGADAIKRFARPVCLQDCPAELLPLALQNENSLNIMRKINGHYTRESLTVGV